VGSEMCIRDRVGGGGGAVPPEARSLTALGPFGIAIGAERQVYAALSSASVHAALAEAEPRDARLVAQTLDFTEHPRRLKPFHLAFAPQDVLARGSLRAVGDLLVKAETGEVLPLTASDYARIVDGFFTAQLVREGERVWSVDSRTALQTLRFDGASGLALDLLASVGVVGARRVNGALYVALDAAERHPVVALAESDETSGMLGSAGRPGLSSARWRVSGVAAGSCTLDFDAAGFGPGDMEWQGAPGRAYAVTAELPDGAGPAVTLRAEADGSGVLRFTLPESAGAGVHVTLAPEAGCGG